MSGTGLMRQSIASVTEASTARSRHATMVTMSDPMGDRIREHFDEFGEGEWDRLGSWPAGRVSFEVHRQFLVDHVRPGDRVLEIGAGPGRFTIELARLGATVVVTDVSAVQLELNERYVREHDAEHAVESRQKLDMRDAGSVSSEPFDVVTALGGPLSYVFEDAPAALSAMLAVVRPGRPVLASVMSLFGAWRAFLPGVIEQGHQEGDEAMAAVLRTGDLRPVQPEGHVCQLYTSTAVRDLAAACGATVIDIRASNWASLGDAATVERLAADPERWGRFVEQEVLITREPGVVDGGTHILFAAVQ